MSPEQFDALNLLIDAKIDAAMVRNSAGPHVRPIREMARAAGVIARYRFTGEVSESDRDILLLAGIA